MEISNELDVGCEEKSEKSLYILNLDNWVNIGTIY